MEEEREKYKLQSLELCDALLSEFSRNKEDSMQFFSGEIYRAYIDATDTVINKTRKIRNKLRDL